MFSTTRRALMFLVLVTISSRTYAQDDALDPQSMMQKMREHGTPGEKHKLPGTLVGKWTSESTMMGMPPTDGTAEFKWILGDRFVQQTYEGSMMGLTFQGMGLYGYDNFKKKFTSTWVDSISTTKNDAEGMLDRTGKVISFYWTMDEYLTGEHDKPVKYVLNMTDVDRIEFEIHDLAIGGDSMVIKIVYNRVKE